MSCLIDGNKIQQAIVVGIWNTPKRLQEYMPEKPLRLLKDLALEARLTAEFEEKPLSDNYLRFVTEELKGYVDAAYRTLSDKAYTFVMGSSMGGLISLYALCEYPHVFSGAACLSTHWPAADGLVIEYLKTALPKPGQCRFYFDYGTETQDACYEPYQQQVDELMRVAGYIENRDWVTRKFIAAEHSERAWRERVSIPLTFLLQQCTARETYA